MSKKALTDIFITTKDRPELLSITLDAIRKYTNRSLYRLTLVQDGLSEGVGKVIEKNGDLIDYVLTNTKNSGLGPSINMALSHISTLNVWYSDKNVGDPDKVSDFICYIQDDVVVTEDWLPRMMKFFMMFEVSKKIGFASGVECFEHTEDMQQIAPGVVMKKYIRAANMFGRSQYWMSMFPIPMFDPETQRVRARPNDGIGSGVDWHFIRNHQNSIERSGRRCIVFPGMMVHAGYASSTWLKRELPESESDKRVVKEILDSCQR